MPQLSFKFRPLRMAYRTWYCVQHISSPGHMTAEHSELVLECCSGLFEYLKADRSWCDGNTG